MGKSVSCWRKIFSGFCVQKSLKSVNFGGDSIQAVNNLIQSSPKISFGDRIKSSVETAELNKNWVSKSKRQTRRYGVAVLDYCSAVSALAGVHLVQHGDRYGNDHRRRSGINDEHRQQRCDQHEAEHYPVHTQPYIQVRIKNGLNRQIFGPGGSNSPQYFYGIRYLGYPLTSTENFTDISPGEPLRRES